MGHHNDLLVLHIFDIPCNYGYMCHSPGFGAWQGNHWHEPWGDMNFSNSTKYLGLFSITRELQFADI